MPANATIEMKAQTVDPNPQLEQLARGGVCQFDVNVEILEEETGTKFTDAMIKELRIQATDALNDTAAKLNLENPEGPRFVVGNIEECPQQ